MKRRGFTLVELVVAIAILGVITLIAIPTINSIQKNNSKSKYKVYDKSINAATKAYTDSYDEDLFGATNSGCAIVEYDDLKDRDLIEDIQIKNNSCSGKDTCVYVRKSKNGNYHYEVHTTCREGSDIVYGTGQTCNPDLCKIEDGNGPEVSVSFSPAKGTYYLDDNPKASIRIKDVGIGLRQNQKLDYEWFVGNRSQTSKKTVNFGNKNYAPSATKYIDLPTTIQSIKDPTVFILKVTGTVYDVNGNATEVNISKNMSYFIGALIIQMKSGKAQMVNPHDAKFSIDSEDYIVSGGSDRTFSRIKYKSTSDLYNYNYSGGINIAKSYYEIVKNKEWKTSSKTYDQGVNYGVSDFGFSDSDLLHSNQTVTVTANWKPVNYTITYALNGGTVSGNPTSYNVETDTFTLKNPTKLGYNFTGWTGSNGTTPQKTVTISKGSHGDKSYTANFKMTDPYYNNSGATFTRLDLAVQGTGSGGWIKLIPSLTTYNDPSTNVNLKWNKTIDLVFANQTINLTNDSIEVSKGTINYQSGTIVTSSQYRNAVNVTGGTFNIIGGTLFSPYTTDKEEGTECIAIKGGTVNMTGGKIMSGQGSSSGYARGVIITKGSFNMSGGHIYVNATKAKKWGGTGINGEGGSVTITGGVVEDVRGGYARCLICGNGSTIKIKSKNTTLKWGGVVRNGGVIFWKDKSQGGSVCIENSVVISVVKKGTTYASKAVKWKKSC